MKSEHSYRFQIQTALLAVTLFLPGAVTAQMSIPSTTTSVFSQFVWLQGGTQNTWRGTDRGDIGIRVGGALSWGDSGAGSTNLVLSGEARTAFSNRTEVSELLRGGVALAYRIDDNGTLVWVAADAFVLPDADVRGETVELAGGLKFLIPVWLPERHPTVLIETHHDFSRYQATYIRSALSLDYKFGVQNGLMFEIGHAWSGLPAGDAVGSTSFGSHGTDLTLTFLRQGDPSKTFGARSSSIEPFLRVLWNERNSDGNLFDIGLRVALVK